MTSDGRATVLIVDDDAHIFPLVEAILGEEPVRIERALSGPEAIAKVDAGFLPDLVLLDIMMPQVGGLEVLEELRGRPGFEQIPILLVTARSRREDVVEGLEAGATDYVTKPFDLGELRARVRGCLRLRSLFLELAAAREAAVREERLRVLVETTGGVAHTLNQPLTAALLKAESLLERHDLPELLRPDLELVCRSLGRVARELGKIRHLTTYRTKPYLTEDRILDLEEES